MKKKLLIIIHFIINFLSWSSWLWLNWSVIAVLSLAHMALLESCDGCFLSHAQFGDRESENTAFYEWWLGKIGVKKYNRAKLKIFMRYWIQLIIVLLGIVVQELFGINTLF